MQVLRRSNKTAQGPDGLQYQHMKLLEEKKIQQVVRDFNTSIQRNEIPEDWLHSYLQLLLKLGKDPSQLSGYRVITVQNGYGKLEKRQ